MPEKCALSHGSGVLGRDPRDSCRFWSPHVETCAQSHRFGLGRVGGGGGYHWGGGGVGEPRTGIIYIYMSTSVSIYIYIYIFFFHTYQSRAYLGLGWNRALFGCQLPSAPPGLFGKSRVFGVRLVSLPQCRLCFGGPCRPTKVWCAIWTYGGGLGGGGSSQPGGAPWNRSWVCRAWVWSFIAWGLAQSGRDHFGPLKSLNLGLSCGLWVKSIIRENNLRL